MGNGPSDQNTTISEVQLWRVSEKLMPGLQDRLGEILGLNVQEVSDIRHSSELSSSRETTLKILIQWQAKQENRNTADTLSKVVKKLDIWEKGLINPADSDHLKYIVTSKKEVPGLSEMQIQCLANRIPTEKYVPVGLNLGLPYRDVAAMWTAAGCHVRGAAFQMLTTWVRGLEPNVKQADTLVKVLEATQQMKLADEVRKGIGLKVNLYESRKVHLRAEKLNKYLGLDEAGNLGLLPESGDKTEQDRYLVDLSIFNTSKMDKSNYGLPVLISFSSQCLTVNASGKISFQPLDSKFRQVSQADERFFYYQTEDDVLSTLRSCVFAKYLCVDSSDQPFMGNEGESAVKFEEMVPSYKKR
eukprot:XP_003723682.1 PREDICTED: uncharacterized protein LOC100893162 [Strongylocentrotus purpuratus]